MGWIDRFKADTEHMRTAIERGTGTIALDTAAGPKRETVTALSHDQLCDYERVAAKVGFAPRGLKTDQMRRFLADSGIRCYPLDKVMEYLTQQYGAEKKDDNRSSWSGMSATWAWRPMRASDQAENIAFYRNNGQRAHLDKNGSLALYESPYAKPLPLPVLLTVEKILDQFPDANFYVSDEYHAPPVSDPFLCVVYGEDPTPLVIERWDEPSFRA